MSLNKTLDRLFDEVRREAKRNPDFADRLDAVLRLHDSRRDVPDGVIEEIFAPASGGGVAPPDLIRGSDGGGATAHASNAEAHRPLSQAAPDSSPASGRAKKTAAAAAPALNPAGLYSKGGEDALRTALADQKLGALRALVTEHNLDPGGVTSVLTRDELAEHIVAQAKRRAERDDKMFDY